VSNKTPADYLRDMLREFDDIAAFQRVHQIVHGRRK